MKKKPGLLKFKSPGSDYLGISISGLCLLHCLLMPFILIALPWMAFTESFIHPLLAVSALFASIFTLWKNRHTNSRIVWICLIMGNLFILTSTWILHDNHSALGELIINSTGSVLLLSGHFMNYHVCKSIH